MRVWRDVLGVLLITGYLVFFSMSWANALSETSPTSKTPQVLSLQSPAMNAKPGLPDPNRLLGLTNQARSTSGAPALTPNQTLMTIAQERANEMAAKKYYAHQSPNGMYYFESLKETEFRDAYSCENLGMGDSTSSDLYISQWMLSEEGHKECLLADRVNNVGYGVAELSFDPTHSDTPTYIVVAIHAGN